MDRAPQPTRRTRLRRAWRAVADRFPLTTLGVVVSLGAYLVWRLYAEGAQDVVLRAAVILAWGLTAVALLGVALATALLRWRVGKADDLAVNQRADVGNRFTSALRLPRFHWWPLVQIEIQWDGPPRFDVELFDDDLNTRERVTPRSRGRLAELTRRLTVRDVFGLATITLPVRTPTALRVAPQMAPGTMRLALRHASAEGHPHPDGEPVGDLVEMRRYAPGDSMRMVLWKMYARTRRLLVRMPERAITPQPSLVAWFVPGPGDEATASAARTFLENGALGTDFVFGADGTAHLMRTPQEAVEAVIESAHHREAGAAGLAVLRTLDASQLGNMLVFVPPVDGPWYGRLAAFVSTLPAPPTLVTAVDTAVGKHPGRLESLLMDQAPRSAAAPDLPTVLALHDALARLGEVRLYHRPTGRVVAPAELVRLRGAA